MANFDDLFTTPAAPEPPSAPPQLTKEEYAAKKKAERDDLYALADEMAHEIMQDGDAFRGFLDVQARFDRYSATNALLIYAQNDKATRLRDFDGWKKQGVYVRRHETGISILEAGDSYVTEDGRTGYYYHVKKVFDIAQTDAKRQPQIHYDDRLLLSALISKRPVPIEMAENVPNGAAYAAYKRGGPVPTLCVLREKLLEQPEEEARDLALALELFTTGSLDAFAHETNVDTQNRIVIYDIMDLGRQLKTMGLLIITDAMLNRVTENWRKGKRTHLFIDEFHVVFQNPYSADFFDSAWRRFRKRGAYPTAITQNVEYLLDSVQASTMLSNSEMLILLNQAPSDREKLAALLNISPEQTSYITNAPAGCGLLRYGGALVPFRNQFPKDTELYRLMTTKPDESIIVGGKTK